MISVFQFSIDVGTTSAPVVLSSTVYLVISLVSFVISAIVALYIVRWFRLKKARKAGGKLSTVVLRIRLPRFLSEDGMKAPELRAVQEDIGVAETFFAGIGGMKAQKGFNAWWNGRTDHVSFEVVVENGLISFYAVAPLELEGFVSQQLQAQFPDADIVRVEDYNIFSPSGVILGSHLKLRRKNLFPIKTYRDLESDPLNALLNALAKVPHSEGAAIQFTVRSAKSEWRKFSFKVVENLHKGATLKDALKGKGYKGDKQSKFSSLAMAKQKEPSSGPVRQMTQREQEMAKSIEEKASKAGMDVNIRVVASAQNVGTTQALLNNILNAFSQFNIYEFGNAFEISAPKNPKHILNDFIHRNFVEKGSFVLNTEELASLWHPPLPGTDTVNVDWLEARSGGAPSNIGTNGLLLGKNHYRGKVTPIYLKEDDRHRHMYMIGKSGSGKTTLIENMVVQDIKNGSGVCVVDPHGDLVESILGTIPKERIDDVIVFSPYDKDMPVGLNMLEAPNEDLRDFAVGEMISIFYKLFPPEMIGPMFEHHMRNIMLTLMADIENPGTIAEIPRMITDEAFQKQWIAKLKDPVVRSYWEQEVANTSDFHKSEMFGYLTSKVGRFVEDEMMRNIIGQTKSGFDFRDVMDNKKILLMDLSKGKTGEVNSQLLGLIVVTKLQMAAMARADIPEDQRSTFFLYIDEFQNYVTPSIATILSEARKYRLDLIIAHQYLGQVVDKGDTEIKDAILGNVGSMFVSRIGPEDSDTFEKIFAPTFTGTDLINSDKHTWYAKMIVDNSSVSPFTMVGDPPVDSNPELGRKIRQLARLKYGNPRAEVEADILERTKANELPKPPVGPDKLAGQ
jgi:hypothetical protein